MKKDRPIRISGSRVPAFASAALAACLLAGIFGTFGDASPSLATSVVAMVPKGVVVPKAFAVRGKVSSYEWEFAVQRSQRGNKLGACLSAALGRPGEATGISRVCRQVQRGPISVANSAGRGPTRVNLLGVMVSPKTAVLTIELNGGRTQRVPVKHVSEREAKTADLPVSSMAREKMA